MNTENSTENGGSAGSRDIHPGDDAAPGTPGTGEDVCQACRGSGKLASGLPCPECGGTGKIVEGIGGG